MFGRQDPAGTPGEPVGSFLLPVNDRSGVLLFQSGRGQSFPIVFCPKARQDAQ